MSKSAKQKAVEAVIISVVVVGGHHRFALGFINITYLSWLILLFEKEKAIL